MYHTEQVFTNIYSRKPPAITYKRRQNTFGSIQRPSTPPIISPSTDSTLFGVVPFICDTPTIQQQQVSTFESTLTTVKDDGIQQQTKTKTRLLTNSTALAPITTTDVFDFPDVDSNDNEVELRVASSLHSNKVNNSSKLNNNNNNNNKLNTKNTSVKTTKTTSTTTNRKTTNNTNNKKAMESPRVRSTTNRAITDTPSIWDMPDTSVNKNAESTTAKRPSSLKRTLSAPTPTTMPPIRSPIAPDIKKRKRNLVAQLKAANGERLDQCSGSSKALRFYDMSSDSDDDPTPPLSLTEPTTEANDYNAQMEQELEDLMKAEFGQLDDQPLPSSSSSSSSSSSTTSSHRPSYVPENTIRAPVTYRRFHNKSSLSASSSTPDGLDLEMEQQIRYLLSDDF
ncbi:hypothetical protein BC941DRAFT_498376 [Chlamydoabsidia padenii]|nr:hypothetical protein BC941DRAFT_498376 [Chlamydoabsidia padenii]